MLFNPELVKFLACPECKTDVEVLNDKGIHCPKCSRVYPIKNGIPVMLLDQSTKNQPR